MFSTMLLIFYEYEKWTLSEFNFVFGCLITRSLAPGLVTQ